METIKPYLDYPKCRIVYEGRPAGIIPQVTGARCLDPLANELFAECINHHEECYAVYLNQRNDVLGVMRVSVGGVTNTVVDSRIVMQGALLANACSVILMHNHPTGNCNPGQSDLQTAKMLLEACRCFGMNFLDSIIVTDSEIYSMANGFSESKHTLKCNSTTLEDPDGRYISQCWTERPNPSQTDEQL